MIYRDFILKYPYILKWITKSPSSRHYILLNFSFKRNKGVLLNDSSILSNWNLTLFLIYMFKEIPMNQNEEPKTTSLNQWICISLNSHSIFIRFGNCNMQFRVLTKTRNNGLFGLIKNTASCVFEAPKIKEFEVSNLWINISVCLNHIFYSFITPRHESISICNLRKRNFFYFSHYIKCQYTNDKHK